MYGLCLSVGCIPNARTVTLLEACRVGCGNACAAVHIWFLTVDRRDAPPSIWVFEGCTCGWVSGRGQVSAEKHF